MTLKKFKIIKLLIVAILAALIGAAVVRGNFFIPLVGLTVAILALLYLRGRVSEIIADERDYEVGGKAARWAIEIYGWIATIFILFFYAQKSVNPAYEAIGATLAYSVCFLLIFYSLLFRYFEKFSLGKNKLIYAIIGLVIFIIVLLFGARLLSGEDDWICKNGEWIKHGAPSFPAPEVKCE